MLSKARAAFNKNITGQQHEGETEEGESLTTILRSPEDRMALTILIADCTEAMQKVIEGAFDANETGTRTDLIVPELEGEKPQQSEDETAASTAEDAEAKKKAEEKQAKELAQREKELSQEKMQELKKAALDHWDEWRSNVIQRVGEVLNSKQEEEQREQHAPKSKEEEAKRSASPPMKFSDAPKYDEGVIEAMRAQYPPIDNPLRKLPQEQRALIMHSLLLLLLSLEHYHAESRTLLLRISTSLDLPPDILGQDESKTARALLAAAENMSADEETKKKAEENKNSRKWKVGLATVGGAVLIGVTGGLAAPLLAAGLGTVMGGLGLAGTAAAGYLGALAGSSVLIGGLFGAYGGRMAGKTMDQYAREVEDCGFEPVRSHHKPRKIEKEFRRLRVGIGISGWLTNQEEVVQPWKVVNSSLETFALRWELEALMNLGNSITTLVTSAAWTIAKKEIIKRTIFGALSAGLWPLALAKVSKVIDNPFSVANYRAQKAGEVLADALINKVQGERPVTLVGYSLGGKVIFACLKKLAERKAFGLIENAVMIGTPAPSTAADWRMIRSVVTGRVVNVYSKNDYILGYLYRANSISLGIAGLQAVENVKGVENVDVSSLVEGHTRYRFLTGPILKQIGFEDLDLEGVAEEEKALKEQDEKEEKERAEHEREQKSADNVSDEDVQKMEQEVEKKNEQSYIGWAQSKMVSAGSSVSSAYEKATAQWRSKGKEPDADQTTTLPERPASISRKPVPQASTSTTIENSETTGPIGWDEPPPLPRRPS
ncbi:putative membrane protein C6F6.13c [Pseudocercospora fuligena]|uniref:Putative membrane protein C6F6.13c n=1 Tax=Pseudocercospora fuligena TaxID=685502 RepID=A0A8H6VER0_9PEZI|nr:putative membrane protein C6F6.13c [Pseudocercospora fuligena]